MLQCYTLYPHRDSPIASYSKGMRQRIVLIAAMMHDPELLVLDEPFSGLDVTSAAVTRELVELLARKGKAVLFSSPVLEQVEKMCSPPAGAQARRRGGLGTDRRDAGGLRREQSRSRIHAVDGAGGYRANRPGARRRSPRPRGEGIRPARPFLRAGRAHFLATHLSARRTRKRNAEFEFGAGPLAGDARCSRRSLFLPVFPEIFHAARIGSSRPATAEHLLVLRARQVFLHRTRHGRGRRADGFEVGSHSARFAGLPQSGAASRCARAPSSWPTPPQ